MKKLITFAADIALTVSLSASSIAAFAAIRKTETPLYSASGAFNEVDWTFKGETASSTFKSNMKGDVAELPVLAWGAGWLCPWKPILISDDKPATLEFDVLEMTSFFIRPYFGSSFQTTFSNIAITPTLGIEVIASQSFADAISAGTGGYYNDRECTEPASGDAEQAGANCWIGLLPVTAKAPNGYRLKFEVYSDGVLYASRTNLNEDGTLSDVCADVYAKGFFPDVASGGTYYFGLNYWGEGVTLIDNFNVYGGGIDACRLDFSGTSWRDTDGMGAGTDKVCSPVANLTQKTIAEISVADFASGDRIVTEEKVKADSLLNEVISVKGSVDVRTLGKKVGIAFGLSGQTDAVGAEGTSYVYIENKTENEETVTYVNVNNGGVEGTPVSLGNNAEKAGLTSFVIDVTKNGSKLVIGENEYALDIKNYNGYVAVISEGDGKAALGIKNDLTIVAYKYRGSDGEAVATNFNTGYINPEKFVVNSIMATQFVNPEQQLGIITENGKLRFAGTGDGAYFKTSANYSDFIVEFKLTEYNDAIKPTQVDSWKYGYAVPVVILGVKESGGWAKGVMLEFKDGILLEDYTSVYTAARSENQFKFRPDEEGVDTKTTAVKIVAVDGVVKIYAFEITESTELKAENYSLVGTFEVPEMFGAISFAATESGYFDIDDVRVVPVDDPDSAKMAENVENFEDFAAIADEHRPFKLEAPEIAALDNVVRWTAVENATGYIVNVNGKLTEVGADVLTFVVEGDPGSYLVTVSAKGNGDYITDSEQSEAVTVVIKAAEDPSTSGGSSNTGSSGGSSAGGSSGCGSSLGTAGVLGLAGIAAAVALFRKKKEN